MIWLAVALGGAAGSVLRYGAGRLAINYFGPTTVIATFAVNVSGSFALGLFYALAADRTTLPGETQALIRALIGIGLIGGYTTFSTFSFETIRLLESGEPTRAAASVLGNLLLSLASAYLGILVARLA